MTRESKNQQNIENLINYINNETSLKEFKQTLPANWEQDIRDNGVNSYLVEKDGNKYGGIIHYLTIFLSSDITKQKPISNILFKLLEFSIDLNQQDSLGRTALHYSVIRNDPLLSSNFVLLGVNSLVKDNFGSIALNYAQSISIGSLMIKDKFFKESKFLFLSDTNYQDKEEFEILLQKNCDDILKEIQNYFVNHAENILNHMVKVQKFLVEQNNKKFDELKKTYPELTNEITLADLEKSGSIIRCNNHGKVEGLYFFGENNQSDIDFIQNNYLKYGKNLLLIDIDKYFNYRTKKLFYKWRDLGRDPAESLLIKEYFSNEENIKKYISDLIKQLINKEGVEVDKDVGYLYINAHGNISHKNKNHFVGIFENNKNSYSKLDDPKGNFAFDGRLDSYKLIDALKYCNLPVIINSCHGGQITSDLEKYQSNIKTSVISNSSPTESQHVSRITDYVNQRIFLRMDRSNYVKKFGKENMALVDFVIYALLDQTNYSTFFQDGKEKIIVTDKNKLKDELIKLYPANDKIGEIIDEVALDIKKMYRESLKVDQNEAMVFANVLHMVSEQEETEDSLKNLEELLDKNPTLIKQKDKDGYNLLFSAITKSKLHTTDLLIKKGADTNSLFHGSTILHSAVDKNNLEMVDLILKYVPNLINVKNANSYTAIDIAIQNKNLEITKFLLENNADILSISDNRFSPLQRAFYKDYTDINIIKTLLNPNVIENIRKLDDKQRNVILQSSTTCDDIEVTKLLLDCCMNRVGRREQKFNLLQSAISVGNNNLVKFLINEPDLTKEYLTNKFASFSHNTNYQLMEMAIIRCNDLQIIKLLLQSGMKLPQYDEREFVNQHYMIKNFAKQNIQSNIDSLLYRSIINQNIDLAKFFIDKGSDVNGVIGSKTMLQFAVEQQDIKMVELLLKHGADINKKNDKGETSIDFAKRLRQTDIVNLLEDFVKNKEKRVYQLTTISNKAGGFGKKFIKSFVEEERVKRQSVNIKSSQKTAHIS